MTQKTQPVNTITLNPLTANLLNVSLAVEATEVALGRRDHLPGMVCFTGHSGLGKSKAASYVAQQYRGFYVEIMGHWRKKELVEMIMLQLGIRPQKGMGLTACIDAVIDELSKCGRPLILDEFDQLVDRKYGADELLLMILNIAKRSNGAILLIGEELLPQKLKKYEKFHNCVYWWYQAVTSDLGDCRILAKHYYPDLEIRDDLMEKTLRDCHGITRRICMNLDAYAVEAASLGIGSIGLSEWGSKGINTGEPPKTRSLK